MRSDPDWAHHCGDGWREAVLTATGRDVCDVIGPMPRRPREFAAMMRRLGVRNLSGVVTAAHGAPIARRQARRGDIVRYGWALGVCRGEFAEFYGDVMLPMQDIDEAWRVRSRCAATGTLGKAEVDREAKERQLRAVVGQ